jgi:hypothetical protein
VTTLVVGALIGFFSAFLLRSWQYRRDLWLKRIDVLCTALDAAAEASTKYWIGEKDAAGAAASRILGLQARVDAMFASLQLDTEPQIVQCMNDFRDSSTGGNFESATFVADHDRARLVQIYASELIAAIWDAAYYQLSFSHWCMRRHEDFRNGHAFLSKQLTAFLEYRRHTDR